MNIRALSILLTLTLGAFLSGCATPVGVTRISPEEGWRTLSAGVLSVGTVSAETQQILNRADLAEEYGKHPDRALSALAHGLGTAPERDRDFAIAELSFLYAAHGGGKQYFLEAALRAYAFLFPRDGTRPGALDPRSRQAVELYNQGILKGLACGDGEVSVSSGTYRLPWGRLELRRESMNWGPFRLEHFRDPSLLRVRGLRNQYRWAGIGAPMVASLITSSSTATGRFARIPDMEKVAVTALLLPDGGADTDGKVAARLELRTTVGEKYAATDGQQLPLEFWLSSAIALTLNDSPIYNEELRGFFHNDISKISGLYMVQPYTPGRIPIVLVHGTASSPARWAQLINEIANDPKLWGRYQFWVYAYNTGLPVLYSAGLFTDTLRRTVAELDPEGRDPAMKEMVIIGHSQGGLLARLAVSSSGDAFTKILRVPPEKLKLSKQNLELLKRTAIYEPLPFVRRVIFMATPHHGSYLSDSLIGRFLGGLIHMPVFLASAFADLITGNENDIQKGRLNHLFNSIEDMKPGSEFIRGLSQSRISPSVTLHSIIAVKDPDGPRAKWTDGVITYESAHLGGAASELIVKSGHSVQEEPAAIEEVRRILDQHAAESVPAR
jgi:triacylglycerol esterase/lipase EstA (alpha/beta hydrolase family)